MPALPRGPIVGSGWCGRSSAHAADVVPTLWVSGGPDMLPEKFGPYRLEKLIGQGGMGQVYRAFDTIKERTVAVKRLPLHLATDTEFKARFRRESKVAARLREGHIIPVHDFGEIDGQLFIDMRLVEGLDLCAL